MGGIIVGLTAQQQFDSRYDYFLVYKDGEKKGICSNTEIERFEEFFPEHSLDFVRMDPHDDWLGKNDLAKINDPDTEIPDRPIEDYIITIDLDGLKKHLKDSQ